jgi:hypothetical protein
MENSKKPHYIVVLKFPVGIRNIVGYVKSICKDMTSNNYFTSSATKVANLKIQADSLDTAETNFQMKPPTITVEARNAALDVVKETLHSLKNDVQEVANASIEDALVIIASSGMSVKRSTGHGKQQDSVIDGDAEGSVILKAAGRGPHDWRYGTDGLVWTLKSTRTSRTKVANLIVGELYHFQNHPTLSDDKEIKWSQTIKFRVR